MSAATFFLPGFLLLVKRLPASTVISFWISFLLDDSIFHQFPYRPKLGPLPYSFFFRPERFENFSFYFDWFAPNNVLILACPLLEVSLYSNARVPKTLPFPVPTERYLLAPFLSPNPGNSFPFRRIGTQGARFSRSL